MKKILFALALGLLLVAALATVALADNGPHGSFTATTDACASCHRAHTAKYGGNALLIMAPDLLCLSCHDGTGAGTNVVDGVYSQAGADVYYPGAGVTVEGTDGASLLGGGFVNALMATSWSGAYTPNAAYNATSRTVTSAHTYDGATTGTLWGSGAANSAAGSMALECVECHDPHGTAGWLVDNVANDNDTRIRSYRLLRWAPAGSGSFTAPTSTTASPWVNWNGGSFPSSDGGSSATVGAGWLVPDQFAAIGTEWYTIGTTSAFAAGDYLASSTNEVYNPPAHNYRIAAANVSFFCSQCHDRYLTNSALRNNEDLSVYCGTELPAETVNGVALTSYPDADGLAPYIHPVDPVRCLPVFNATTAAFEGWGDDVATADTNYMYMHASGDIRTSSDGTVNGNWNYVTQTWQGTGSSASPRVGRGCVACHVAHGTSAYMTDFAGDATLTAGTPVATTDNTDNSTLLRMDNRSMCLRCHASTVNYTVAP